MNKHILVVEDEMHMRISISLALRGEGFEVSVARNAAEAMELLKTDSAETRSVDLVLTDIHMPEMDGIEFMRILKKEGMTVPIIAITGYGNKEMIVQLLRHGCKDYLDKPVNPEEVVASIKKVLEDREAEKSRQAGDREGAETRTSRLSNELDAYKLNLERLQQEIDTAVDAYQKLMVGEPKNMGIDVAWRNRPLAKLGGDFMGMGSRSNVHDFIVADVSGHDMGSSFHTIMIKAFFEENCRRGNDGQTLFHLLNRHMMDRTEDMRMITSLFLRIDLEAMAGEAVSAAHPPVIVLKKRSSQCRIPEITGTVLGIYEDVEYTPVQFSLEPGDRIILHTDGVTGVSTLDVDTGHHKKLTAPGLIELIHTYQILPIEEMIDHIWRDVLTYCGHKPNDDMLLFALKIPE